MPTAFNNISDELRKHYAQNQEKEIADSDSFYNTQVDTANKLYDAQVDKQNKAYEDSNRENAIQKLINERQVAENMANLGLTNSGLNRTRQTAVQLSYANNKAYIDRQKQSAIADIESARTQALNTIEQNRFSDKATINQNYENMINETAQSIYKDNEEQQEQNSYIIKTPNALLSRELVKGSLKDSGVDTYKITKDGKDYIRYVDKNSGNSVELEVGVNPYTGDDNSAFEKKYGVFSNGYQPKGVEGYGAFDKNDKGYVVIAGKAPIRGREQNVFRITKKGETTYWVWDGANNKYTQYKNTGTNSKGETIWEKVKK